jgi:hypothetical protein
VLRAAASRRHAAVDLPAGGRPPGQRVKTPPPKRDPAHVFTSRIAYARVKDSAPIRARWRRHIRFVHAFNDLQRTHGSV